MFCFSPPSPFVSVAGPPSHGTDGWGASDDPAAHDVQPACPQTHQPLRPHTWSSGTPQSGNPGTRWHIYTRLLVHTPVSLDY